MKRKPILFVVLAPAALLALAACANRETAPASPPADTSASSPMTVNPEPKAIPQTPPIAPAPDKAMPPGPVNPTPR